MFAFNCEGSSNLVAVPESEEESMSLNTLDLRPTPERPLLLGLLVDVSGTMRDSIENRRGTATTRLESFRDALEQLIQKAGSMSREGTDQKVAPLLKLFAYGFGFGGLLSVLFGPSGPSVRDLLALPGTPTSTVPLDQLTSHWLEYRAHVERLAPEMLGKTPMQEGFRVVRERFSNEYSSDHFTGRPVLFVLSDGDPTDATPDEVSRVAYDTKGDGVIVVSCYVTSDDIAEPRRLYAAPREHWPQGARLMLDCASEVPPESSFANYLKEYNWTIEPRGRLFTQINQSEVLSEFMSVVLSPLRAGLETATSGYSRMGERNKVFISYSHEDTKWLKAIKQQLAVLEAEGLVSIYEDTQLEVGEDWYHQLNEMMRSARLGLLLISAPFLGSKFVRDEEIPRLFAQHEQGGMKIYPLLVRPCPWERVAWLAKLELRPQDAKRRAKPISTFEGPAREQILVDVANEIADLVKR
jgi:hypothetical protein